MTRLVYKASSAIATAALLTSVFAGAALANGPSCKISGNGNRSINTCVVVEKKLTVDVKKNRARVANIVIAAADTGGNTTNNNTTNGGDVENNSGDATVNVTINNSINQNN